MNGGDGDDDGVDDDDVKDVIQKPTKNKCNILTSFEFILFIKIFR